MLRDKRVIQHGDTAVKRLKRGKGISLPKRKVGKEEKAVKLNATFKSDKE